MNTLVLPTAPATTRRETYRIRVRRARRGRYRTDRMMVRLTTPAVPAHCVDLEWLDHMVDYWDHHPQESQAYVRLRNKHQLTHGCAG